MLKRTKIIICSIVILIIMLFVVPKTLSLFKSNTQISGDLNLAEWNVSLVETGANTSLTVVPGTSNATYAVSVRSLSEVDVEYDIIITNLPAGVEVSLDNGSFQTQANNTITFANAGTILYSDSLKTKSHTLTFRAASGTAAVNNQTVNINVIVQQAL